MLHPRFPALPKIGMTLAPFLLYRAVRRLVERLRRERGFDLIDAHYFYPDGVAAAMLGRRLGVPTVITARGTDVNLIAQYRFPRRMIRWAASQAGAVVAVSQALKDKLAALGVERERIHALRNGVDLELFHPANRDSAARGAGAARPDAAERGQPAWRSRATAWSSRRSRSYRSTELVIAGDGPDRAAFEALARQCGVSGRVRFVGSLNQQDLRRLLLRSRCARPGVEPRRLAQRAPRGDGLRHAGNRHGRSAACPRSYPRSRRAS